jgi:hypothetical protein
MAAPLSADVKLEYKTSSRKVFKEYLRPVNE